MGAALVVAPARDSDSTWSGGALAALQNEQVMPQLATSSRKLMWLAPSTSIFKLGGEVPA